MPTNNTDLEKNLWAAADELRANSKLRAVDYSIPVLGLLFLKYADHRFAHATGQFKAEAAEPTRRRRQRDPLSPDRYKAAGVLYIPEEARYQRLVEVPEGENVGRRINDAMKAIEEQNEAPGMIELSGAPIGLSQVYHTRSTYAERICHKWGTSSHGQAVFSGINRSTRRDTCWRGLEEVGLVGSKKVRASWDNNRW
jgi:hypothetical protein